MLVAIILLTIVGVIVIYAIDKSNDNDEPDFVFVLETPTVSPSGVAGTSTPTVVSTPRAGSSATPQVSQPLSDRTSCDAIRGTAYRSSSERTWFLANCVTAPSQASTPRPSTNLQASLPADICYDRFGKIGAGTQFAFPAMGCNIVGNVDLLIGSVFIRQYDDLPNTGSFTPCTNGCTVIARETINATSKSIDELNNSPASSCGPGCRFTYPQTAPAPTVAAPPPDKCYDAYHGIAAGTQVTIPAMGCNIVGNIDLLIGGTFKRQYDSLPETGSFTPCGGGCTFIARETVNATDKSIDQLNNSPASSCGPGCKFTYPQVVPAN